MTETKTLPHYEAYLTKANSIKWKFLVTATLAHSSKDPFKLEQAALEYLSHVGQLAHEPVKNLEWFIRVEEHHSGTLHLHILLGSFKLIEADTDIEALRCKLTGFWRRGICKVTDFNGNSLAYVTKVGLNHCLPSKRLRRLSRTTKTKTRKNQYD